MPERHKAAAKERVRRAWITVGAPILGLVIVTIMLAIAAFAGFARQQDATYEETSRRLIASTLEGRMRSVMSVTLDYSNWDEAVAATIDRWDERWFEENIYSSVVNGMLAMSAEGTVRYAWYDEASNPDAESLTAAATHAALTSPRLRQLARAATAGETVTSAFAVSGEQLIFVAIAPITAEDDDIRRRRRNDPTFFVFLDVLTPAELESMGRALDLNDLAFAPAAPAASRNTIVYTLRNARDEPAGALVWRHARPGAAAFERQIWAVIIALLVVGALALLVARLLVSRYVNAMADAMAARDSSRHKSEFLARVSHELRTPLTAIIGYAEIICEEEPDSAASKDSARIIQAARHLNHLLDDIFEQARIDAGRIKFTPEVVPVAGVLAEVGGLLRPAADANGVKFTHSSDALATYVVADHMRLRQCLLNLTANAIKFSPKGEVSIRARSDAVEGRPMVIFDVTDNGIGIAKSDIANLFRPFGQANANVSRDFGGTGLGLSISRDLVRAMGGDINVRSEPGVGSTFSLSVPAVTAMAIQAA